MNRNLALAAFAVLATSFSACVPPTSPTSSYRLDGKQVSHQPEAALMAQAKAVQLFQAGKFEEALREIDRAAKLHPENTQIALVQCTLQRRTGHLEEALVGLSRVIDRKPDHADALCQRAFVYQQIGAAGWAEHAFHDSDRSIES